MDFFLVPTNVVLPCFCPPSHSLSLLLPPSLFSLPVSFNPSLYLCWPPPDSLSHWWNLHFSQQFWAGDWQEFHSHTEFKWVASGEEAMSVTHPHSTQLVTVTLIVPEKESFIVLHRLIWAAESVFLYFIQSSTVVNSTSFFLFSLHTGEQPTEWFCTFSAPDAPPDPPLPDGVWRQKMEATPWSCSGADRNLTCVPLLPPDRQNGGQRRQRRLCSDFVSWKLSFYMTKLHRTVYSTSCHVYSVATLCSRVKYYQWEIHNSWLDFFFTNLLKKPKENVWIYKNTPV